MKLRSIVSSAALVATATMVAAPAVAQAPVTSRDAVQPALLIVEGLSKPFQAVAGDIVRFVLQPQAGPTELIRGLTISGVPRLREIAESSPYIIEWDTAGYAPGLYRLRQVKVMPNDARIFAPVVEVELLQEQPISVQVPKEPSGTFPVSIEARAEYKLRRLELLVDGQQAGMLTSLPGQVMISSPTLACGPHMLWLRAVDQKDREFVSRPVSFFLPEVVKLTQPSSESQLITSAGAANLRLVAEHNLGERVKRVEFILDGRVIGEADERPFELNYSGPLPRGLHRLRAAAVLDTDERILSREVTIYAVPQEQEPARTAPQLIARVKPALVLVEVTSPESEQTASATGFFINDSGYLATSHHVIASATAVFVRTADGRRVEARIAARDQAEDIAVLLVPQAGQQPIPLGEDSMATEGLEILVAGFPYGESLKELGLGVVPSFNPGTINALRPARNAAGAATTLIHFDALIRPGMSGAPLLDKSTGKVLGIVRSSLVGEVTGPTGINLAARVGVLRRLLNRSGIRFVEESPR